MAKPKLMTYRQWQQREKEKKERAKIRRAEAKHAKLEAYWSVPAQSNYVELSASWGPGDIHVRGRILPDKRYRKFSGVGISMTVDAGADRERVAQRLAELAQAVLSSEEIWATVNGAPLARPMTVEGFPIHLSAQSPWQPHGEGAMDQRPEPTVTPATRERAMPGDLLALRSDLERWLRAHRTDDSPLALLTIEQLAEVLLMRVCGNDILLTSDRDPWRWDHTTEELRAVDGALSEELSLLSLQVLDLNRRLGAEAATSVLLEVFVEGLSA